MLSKASISLRTTLAIGALSIAAFGASAYLITQKAGEETRQAAKRELQAIAAKEVGVVRRDLERVLANVASMGVAAESIQASGESNRKNLTELVRRFAESDPGSLGYWFEFEPNGFDGRDTEMPRLPSRERDAIGITDSGRISIYWVQDAEAGLTLTPTAGPENDKDIQSEEHYAAAKAFKAEMMFEPYLYEVNGKPILMTSLMSPILFDGEVLGIAGADISLQGLQESLAVVRPYGTGVVRLISPKGQVMAGPEADALGKRLDSEDLDQVLGAGAAGKTIVLTSNDAAVGGRAVKAYVPFRVGRAESEHFILEVSAPYDQVMAGVYAIRDRILIIGILSALALCVVAWIIITRLVRDPLNVTVSDVEAIADGNLSHAIRGGGDDEVGRVANALRRMQGDLRARIEADAAIASENLRIRTALDGAGAAVLIADAKGAIVYLNRAMDRVVDDILGEKRAARASNLVGQPIDAIHPIGDTATERQAVIRVGSRTYLVTITPIIDASGSRMASMVDWKERTEEIAVEEEVRTVVAATTNGDFSQRIEESGKTGFFKVLATALNEGFAKTRGAMDEVGSVMRRLAEGDLTARMEGQYEGKFGEIRDSIDETVSQLSVLIGQIQSSASHINTASSEIAAGNQDLSARTEQQAASLEETAASMEELTATVKQNAESANQAKQLADGAADVATKGGQVVAEVVTTMSGIEASSRKVADIISTIDGIAFQTNILALNAAVEAARAGDQGRGFAVVASEVRALAQRSAAAAKEIKALIEESVAKVESGTKLVGTAGETMQDIVSSVRRVTDIMAEISAASAEQSSGIEQVNQTITHMDQTTQQNAALVEEATAAAKAMEDQAEALTELVARFRTA